MGRDSCRDVEQMTRQQGRDGDRREDATVCALERGRIICSQAGVSPAPAGSCRHFRRNPHPYMLRRHSLVDLVACQNKHYNPITTVLNCLSFILSRIYNIFKHILR